MKKAYVVVELIITDPVGYEGYRQIVLPTIEAFGGQFLVRGGERTQYEGEMADGVRTVIVEFPSLAQAKAWYDSPAYVEARAMRQQSSEGKLFIVEGL